MRRSPKKAADLPKYIIRGHGGTNKTLPFFRLKPNQYVIFPSKCGMPASMGTMHNNPRALKLLQEPKRIINYIEGRSVNVPTELKNISIQGPGTRITNSIVELKNTTRFPFNPERSKIHKRYHNTTGIYKLNVGGHPVYIEGRGQTVKISRVIGNKSGFFWIDACRVAPGTTQNEANRALRTLLAGERVNVMNTNLRRIANAERASRLSKSITSRIVFGTKRFRESNSIRRNRNVPPAKRRKISTAPTYMNVNRRSPTKKSS
jgi:hypothetical protein